LKLYFKIKNKLKGKTIKALAWSFFSNAWTKIISFIISIFLARILDPEEFGIIGITLAIIAILKTISNLGFASALIQVKKIEKGVYSTVFWFNIICSLVLYFLLFILANSISVYFEINELTLVIKILGFILLFDALSIIQRTYLKRKLDFKSIATTNIVSDLTGGILGVISAFNGLGVFALVVQHIVRSLMGFFVFWYLSDWRPEFIFKVKQLKQLFSFSIFKFIDSISKTFFEKITVFFVGGVFDTKTLGYFSRSESFRSFIMQTVSMPITNVMFPHFSKIQDNIQKLKKHLIFSNNTIAFIVTSIVTVLYFWGGEIIILLFGDKWLPSVPIFKILIIAALFKPITTIQACTILAKGFSNYDFYLNLIQYAFVLISILLGNYFNFSIFLYSLVLGQFIFFVIQTFFVSQILKLNSKFLFLSSIPYFMSFFSFITIFNFTSNEVFFKIFLNITALVALVLIYYKRFTKFSKTLLIS
jgi:O-antigen/teichoic acid export membrane protein